MMTKPEDIENQKIGSWQTWKFGIVARDVFRRAEDEFEIHETSSGWRSALVDKETMQKLLSGEIDIYMLDWE